MTESDLLALKSTISRHRRERPRRNVGFPDAVRREAVQFAHGRRSAGATLARIAAELGLATNTVERWLRLSPKRKLRPVRVHQAERNEVPGSKIVLHGPHGVRVEGLDAQSVAAIVRALA